MEVNKKLIVILLILGFVILLTGYFVFSPAAPKTEKSPEAQEMTDSINDYNEKFNIYSNSYSDASKYGNSIGSDSMITFNELVTYETELRDYINASDTMFKQATDTKQMVAKYSNRFTSADYARILSEFDNRISLIKTDLNNMIVSINVLRGNVPNPEHNKILNDLSVELMKIRDSV